MAAVLSLLTVGPVLAGPTPPDLRSERPRATVAAAVDEASRRFGVPVNWIWRVIRAESGGDAQAVSSAGAMGLMQLMPATYADLRKRHGLGADPFAVRDNILAGTAYLRELHDRYGAYGMLAAYNAGPGRWEDHLATGRSLPGETQRYLARLAPAVAPGAANMPPPYLSAPPASPLAAPIFVAIATATMPSDATPKRARPAVDRPLTGDATAAPISGPPTDRPAIGVSHPEGHRPAPPRSGALFVSPTSHGASR